MATPPKARFEPREVRIHGTTNFERVQRFHDANMVPRPEKPQLPSKEVWELRKRLINEEWQETQEAYEAGDLVKFFDGLLDLLVVVYGTGDVSGLAIDRGFPIVHASNMSKLGEDGKPILREDGKVLKGPNYWPADPKLAEILDESAV